MLQSTISRNAQLSQPRLGSLVGEFSCSCCGRWLEITTAAITGLVSLGAFGCVGAVGTGDLKIDLPEYQVALFTVLGVVSLLATAYLAIHAARGDASQVVEASNRQRWKDADTIRTLQGIVEEKSRHIEELERGLRSLQARHGARLIAEIIPAIDDGPREKF